MKIGVIIGRFQVPELTLGHKNLVQRAFQECGNVIILLGTPTFQNNKNPLDFAQRLSAIRASYNQTPVYPLLDNISDEVWSRNLDDFLKRTYPHAEFVLYHGRDSFAPHYTGKLPVVDVGHTKSPSGSDVRRAVANNPVFTVDYRRGYIAAHEHSFPSVRTAVDIVMQHANGDVLLVKKPNEDQWRFPGGMVDKGETGLQAAKRELQEETGLEGGNWKLVAMLPVEDWRNRGSKHGVLSGIFMTDYLFGKPVAKDDVSDTMWVTKARLDTYLIPEHRAFLKELVAHVK